MQTKIAFVLPICMVMYSRNFVKPHLSCYTFGSQAANLNNLQTPDWCQSLQCYAGIPWSPVCQLIVVIDNFAWVISGAGGNMYIRQMNICGHINLLNTTNTQNVVYHSKSLNTYYLPHWIKNTWRKTNHDMFVCRNCDPARPVLEREHCTDCKASRREKVKKERNLV